METAYLLHFPAFLFFSSRHQGHCLDVDGSEEKVEPVEADFPDLTGGADL